MKWAPNTVIQPHLEIPRPRLHNWLTIKLHYHFLFRKFNPENQSVDISMKSPPNNVIQPHLETHWPRLHNWSTLKLCHHFLFRKFDPKINQWSPQSTFRWYTYHILPKRQSGMMASVPCESTQKMLSDDIHIICYQKRKMI